MLRPTQVRQFTFHAQANTTHAFTYQFWTPIYLPVSRVLPIQNKGNIITTGPVTVHIASSGMITSFATVAPSKVIRSPQVPAVPAGSTELEQELECTPQTHQLSLQLYLQCNDNECSVETWHKSTYIKPHADVQCFL